MKVAIAMVMAVMVMGFASSVCCQSGGKVNVHVVPHTHDDVGWLKTIDQYYMGANNSIQHAGVQYILDSVYEALMRNPDRKFSYVEMAFFQRWWNQQDATTQANVKKLVATKQLEFINGGWCMHDEATTHYMAMIDQTTLGHKYIKLQFGEEAIPSVGWQIDPFGHSASQATYMTNGFGFNGLVVGRIDYADRQKRTNDLSMEMVWTPSVSLGDDTRVFASCDLGGNYQPPSGLCFDQFCSDPPVQDDPTLEDYNVQERVNTFVNDAYWQANRTMGSDIIFKFGSDFQYENANEYFKNLDKLIAHVNQDGRVRAFYSTPRMYIESKASQIWPTKVDDFFPYADNPNSYWTGYFTSRPALKGYVRSSLGTLQSLKQLAAWGNLDSDTYVFPLEQAVAIAQHHDAVAGTSKQHVAYDYALRISQGMDVASSAMADVISDLLGGVNVPPNGIPLSQCPLKNISVCDGSSSTSGFMLVLYNPSSRSRNMSIHVPVAHNRMKVTNARNHLIPSAIFPTAFSTALVELSLPYALHFQAVVPANGWTTYFIQDMVNGRMDRDTQRRRRERAPNTFVMRNKFLELTFGVDDGMIESVTDLTSGLRTSFTEGYMYYHSYVRDLLQQDDQASGAYIFRPDSDTPVTVTPSTDYQLHLSPVVSEVRKNVSEWIQRTVRLSGDTPYFEIEYTVGPIPIHDNIGKEVIIRYDTDIASASTFFTDSNGREMQQRILNYRPTWTLNVTQAVAGNYYPVNVAAYVKDSSRQLSVVVDRSQGAASLFDGSMEFMVHRRILHDDHRGVGEPLNETEGITPYPKAERIGMGLNVTGVHRISFGSSKPSVQNNANDIWRTVASQSFHDLEYFFGALPDSVSSWISTHNCEGTLVGMDLPPNVDLETLSSHPTESGLLLRLGHNFAVGESDEYSVPVVVDIQKLLSPYFKVLSLREETLAAGPIRPMIQWNTGGWAYPPVQSPTDFKVTLQPMQIRTFLLVVDTV